jgi:cytochrome P450
MMSQLISAAQAPAVDGSAPLPPGPRGLPLIGSGVAFWRDPIGFFERGAARFGDVVRYRFGPRQVVVLRNPEHVRAVLVTQQQHFIKGGAEGWFKTFAGQGLFTSEGDLHRRHRRLAQPAFHHHRIEGYGPAMAESARRRRERWSPGQIIDINDEMRELTMIIVSRAMFDADVEADAHDVGAALTTIMRLFRRYTSPARVLQRLPLPSRFRIDRARSVLDAMIDRIIAEHRARTTDGATFLSALSNARDQDGHPISHRQLRDELVTILIAGHETAANALAWTWYLIGNHPEVERNVHHEIDQVLGDRLPTTADVPRLRYIEQTFAESLRLYPPLWAIGRKAVRDVEIGGYSVPAGTVVIVSPYLTHRDARYFDDPQTFRPERWTAEMKAALPRLAYFPFGAGGRQCLGDGFAWLEAPLILATIAQKWRLHNVAGHRVSPRPLATLRPRDGILVRVEPRR